MFATNYTGNKVSGLHKIGSLVHNSLIFMWNQCISILFDENKKNINENQFGFKPIPLKGVRPIFAYSTYKSEMKQLITRIKYNKDRVAIDYGGNLLARLIFSICSKLNAKSIYIIPVPSSNVSFSKREYAHTVMLVEACINSLKKMVLDSTLNSLLVNTSLQMLICLKNNALKPQTSCKTKKERVNNIQNQFSISPQLLNRIENDSYSLYFIIDDVVTTGATLNSAAITLTSAVNSSSIYCVAIAHKELT